MKLINDEGLEQFGQYVTDVYANEEETTDTLSTLESEIDDHTHTASTISEVGDLNTLETTETTTLVGAINELYNTFNNKGKELIANAVGEPLQSTDSFQGLSNDINDLLSQFKTNMMNAGVVVDSGDKFKALIDKIKGLTEGEGNKGIQFASGVYGDTGYIGSTFEIITIDSQLDFTPTHLFIQYTNAAYCNNVIVDVFSETPGTTKAGSNYDLTCTIYDTFNPQQFKIQFKTKYGINELRDIRWYAIGVGEEDTVLRDSLANILEDEGVEITEEDDMANLIVKTDKEFADNTNKLYEIMSNGGYEVDNNMNLDALLDILEKSGIFINDIKQIASGYNHTFILKKDGSLWACGWNYYGELGLGDDTDITIFTQVTTNINNDVKQIVCGYRHTFILKTDGSVWSCGVNSSGQLGLGDTTKRNTFTQVTTNINNDVEQIAGGQNHTIILKNDGSIWSCGYNEWGQLGLGDDTDRNIFTQVVTNINNDVKQVSCGSNHTFVLKTDGSVWVCGVNNSGQLGLGDNTDRNIFMQVTTNINKDVKQIAGAYRHTFILKTDGSVWSCGCNEYGQLGLGDTTQRDIFTQVVTNINNDVKQVSCGSSDHTFILKNDNSVWSCGYNEYGQLGLGSDPYRITFTTTFTQVTTNTNNDVKQVSCAYDHTFILKNDNSVWSCGKNDYGELGLGDNTQRDTFTQVTTYIYIKE